MTNAYFCDIHPNKQDSLIRGDKTSVSTIVIQTVVKETQPDGKKISWTRETKINACAKCVAEKLLKPALALEVELEYDEYRLVQENGKYKRVVRASDESKATPTPLST